MVRPSTMARTEASVPSRNSSICQPIAALIRDLKQRGLFEETLIVWSGEFGRTSMNEERNGSKLLGRDHHPHCFTIWMAGGGIQGGVVHGETDDFSYNIVEDPVKIADINNTILHCLGIDHRRLSVKFQGLDIRLTGVEEHNPVQAILA